MKANLKLNNSNLSGSIKLPFRSGKTCYVWLARRTIWGIVDDTVIFSKTGMEDLSITEVAKFLENNNYSKVFLVVEFPWILLEFNSTISLSKEDASQFCRNNLSFHNFDNQLARVGGSFIELGEQNRKGILGGALAHTTLELIQAIKGKKSTKVEVFPSLYICLSRLLKVNSDKILFYGIEQKVILYKRDDKLESLTLIPESLAKEEFLPEDFLGINDTDIQNVQLGLEVAPNADEVIHLSARLITNQWKNSFKQEKLDFWWETKKSNLSLNWKLIGMVVIILVLGTMIWQTNRLKENHRELIHQVDLAKLEIKADETKISRFKAYAEEQKQFIQIETLYKHLGRSKRLSKRLLEELMVSLDPQVWIEHLVYQDQNVKLTLLGLDQSSIPSVLKKMDALPFVNNVLLDSQQIGVLEGQSIIRFSIRMDLHSEELLDESETTESIE